MLATLLVHPGQPVSTDLLSEEVWPDGPSRRAANLLSVYVHHLRKLIGDTEGKVLVTRAPGYQVVLSRGELDADLFTRLVAVGRQALADGEPSRAVDLLTEALGLWRGQALADVPATALIAAEAAGWRSRGSRRWSCGPRRTWPVGGPPRWLPSCAGWSRICRCGRSCGRC